MLATNRILDTPISRSGSANSFRPELIYRDLAALSRIGGHKTLFAGLLPFIAFHYVNTKSKKDNKRQLDGSPQVQTRTITARRAIQEQFGISGNVQQFDQGTSFELKNLEVFEQSDAMRGEKSWLPWSQRYFPAIYRSRFVNSNEIDDRISEVMLSSSIDGEEEPDDAFISSLLVNRQQVKDAL